MSALALKPIATETLLERAFARRALIPACEACDVLGLDEKTFRALVEAGAIRSVPVGENSRRFAEADLRAFLNRETRFCPSIATNVRHTGNTTSSIKVVGFTEARAKRRKNRPKKS